MKLTDYPLMTRKDLQNTISTQAECNLQILHLPTNRYTLFIDPFGIGKPYVLGTFQKTVKQYQDFSRLYEDIRILGWGKPLLIADRYLQVSLVDALAPVATKQKKWIDGRKIVAPDDHEDYSLFNDFMDWLELNFADAEIEFKEPGYVRIYGKPVDALLHARPGYCEQIKSYYPIEVERFDDLA